MIAYAVLNPATRPSPAVRRTSAAPRANSAIASTQPLTDA